MQPEQIFRRYQDLQAYVGWTDADSRRIGAAAPVLAPSFPMLIEDFYAEITRHPDAVKVITGGIAQIERLKETLHAWLADLFSGQYDAAYAARRWRAGWRHVEIGLDQVYANVALSRLRTGLTRELQERWQGDANELRATVRALNKLLDLDLAIIEDAYRAEQLKLAQAQALQAERLAAIGQMMAGLAHESGNALARSQACLETLTLELEDRPEALDLIGAVQKAQDHLRQLYEDVRGYAAPLPLEREWWDLSGIWRQAWQNLALKRQGRNAELREAIEGPAVHGSVDHFRLEQVFRNIFDNALAACRDPVVIEVRCEPCQIDGAADLRIVVTDNGPGLTAEQRRRIFEPFFTTKTKGTGLGMAIAKRLVEAHGGDISVGAAQGGGAEIVIRLPRGEP